MWRGLLRFSSTILPVSWSQFLIARDIKDFNRDYVISRRDQEMAVEQAQYKDMDYEYPSETQQQVAQRTERTTKLREQLSKDLYRKLQVKPWRQDKKEWEYFYLKGIKSWRFRGKLETPVYAADVPFSDVLYFPELVKWSRRYKRFKKRLRKATIKLGEVVTHKINTRNVFKCPPITEAEAYMVLNIEPQVDTLPDMQLVWERYQTLADKNCPTPEHSGSIYLDAKVESAKDFFFQKIPGAAEYQQRKIDESGVVEEMKKFHAAEEEAENAEWLNELDLVSEEEEIEAGHFHEELARGDYLMPRWMEYRYYKVKELDIKFKIEQKKLLAEEKQKMVERKRKQKETRLIIQELQDKVDKILEEGGDPSGIVFPQLPPEEPSKVQVKVDESLETLEKQLEEARAFIIEKFAEEYQIDPTFSMFDGETTIEEESEYEVLVEYDYNDDLQKREIIALRK